MLLIVDTDRQILYVTKIASACDREDRQNKTTDKKFVTQSI